MLSCASSDIPQGDLTSDGQLTAIRQRPSPDVEVQNVLLAASVTNRILNSLEAMRHPQASQPAIDAVLVPLVHTTGCSTRSPARAGSGSTKGEIMNWDQLECKWSEFSGSARAHWSVLTDDDWKAITGKKAQLVSRIKQRYGISREAAEHQVEEWSNGLLDTAVPARAR